MPEHTDKNPTFLAQRFSKLSGSLEVQQAERRSAELLGITIKKTPEDQIQNYLDRFTEIVSRTNPAEKARGIAALKQIIIEKYVVRVEDIPEGYWQAQMRIARDRGQAGDWQDLSEEDILQEKERHLVQVKEDQKGSLEEWIDYLASDISKYLPDYLKYWAFAGMLKLERYVKGNKEEGKPGRFPERSSGKQRSIKMFPEVNERALKFIANAYQGQFSNQVLNFRHDIPDDAVKEFLDPFSKKDFRELYGWGQEYIPPISEEEMQTTDGDWILYTKGDENKLTSALRGKGSGWCIAGTNLAHDYLSRGSLHVYYTKDRNGEFIIPRVVIVQTGNKVTQVRGIEWEENVDEHIKPTTIISEKLTKLAGGADFFAIDTDTKQLTIVDRKVSTGEKLSAQELIFLYELDKPITYFGYEKDPRINELRSFRNLQADLKTIHEYFISHTNEPIPQAVADAKQLIAIEEKENAKHPLNQGELVFLYQINRTIQLPDSLRSALKIIREQVLSSRNPKEDALVVFGSENQPLRQDEIALSKNEIVEYTKVYIGTLFPAFFEKFGGIEHIYTSFPEGKVARDKVIIATKDRKELLQAMKSQNIYVYSVVKEMIKGHEFMPQTGRLTRLENLFRGETMQSSETVDIVKLKVRDLGFTDQPTTTELFKKVEELGLELCPAEVGPHYRMQYTDQPLGEKLYIGMEPVVASGSPNVFRLERTGYGLWLNNGLALPDILWNLDYTCVFRFRNGS